MILQAIIGCNIWWQIIQYIFWCIRSRRTQQGDLLNRSYHLEAMPPNFLFIYLMHKHNTVVSQYSTVQQVAITLIRSNAPSMPIVSYEVTQVQTSVCVLDINGVVKTGLS